MHFLLFLNSTFEVESDFELLEFLLPLFPFFLPLLLLVIYRKFYFNYKATTKTNKQKYKN